MKITYDRDSDVLTITLRGGEVDESDEETTNGMVYDYNEKGDLIAIEILDASASIENPESIEFQVVGREGR